jgi:hypothetical protein
MKSNQMDIISDHFDQMNLPRNPLMPFSYNFHNSNLLKLDTNSGAIGNGHAVCKPPLFFHHFEDAKNCCLKNSNHQKVMNLSLFKF